MLGGLLGGCDCFFIFIFEGRGERGFLWIWGFLGEGGGGVWLNWGRCLFFCAAEARFFIPSSLSCMGDKESTLPLCLSRGPPLTRIPLSLSQHFILTTQQHQNAPTYTPSPLLSLAHFPNRSKHPPLSQPGPPLPPPPHLQTPSKPPRLLNIILTSSFILAREKPAGILAQPLRQLGQLLAQAGDGLLVHVCLGDEFGHGDCVVGGRGYALLLVCCGIDYGGEKSEPTGVVEREREGDEIGILACWGEWMYKVVVVRMQGGEARRTEEAA